MNEQLQSKLVEILTAIQNAAKVAGDFALDQLPDVAQQYLLYGRITSLVDMLIWLVLMGASCYVAFKKGHFSDKPDEYGGWPMGKLGAALGGSFAFIGSLLGALISVQHAAFVWFAPKVWLIKELSALTK